MAVSSGLGRGHLNIQWSQSQHRTVWRIYRSTHDSVCGPSPCATLVRCARHRKMFLSTPWLFILALVGTVLALGVAHGIVAGYDMRNIYLDANGYVAFFVHLGRVCVGTCIERSSPTVPSLQRRDCVDCFENTALRSPLWSSASQNARCQLIHGFEIRVLVNSRSSLIRYIECFYSPNGFSLSRFCFCWPILCMNRDATLQRASRSFQFLPDSS